MSIIEGLLIFIAILSSYFMIVFILHKKGILKKYSLSFTGPFLLLRTKKGRGFLKKIASKKRFWKAYGSFAIVLAIIIMIIMVIIFVWQFSWLLGLDITAEQKAELPGPEFALVLPGINPIIPLEYLFYVILAFIIAIIVHEFSHGILTYASDLKVKTMGLIYLIVPMGAFVEPDEEQLKKTTIAKRMRIFAAGPIANFVVVLITIMLFSFVFMSSVEPIQPIKEGVTVFEVIENSPADKISITKRSVILSINETELSDYENFDSRFLAFSQAISQINSNDTVNISYYYNGKYYDKNITVDDKYNYTGNITDIGKAFTGIYSFIPIESHLEILKNPITTSFPDGFLFFFVLPITSYFEGYNPIVSPFTDSYEINGPLGALPAGFFWFIVNALYWVFWLNLMVGLFNVLPMGPLDGGYLFKDLIRGLVKKIKKGISEEKLEKIVKNVSLVISLTILFLILFPFLFKYI